MAWGAQRGLNGASYLPPTPSHRAMFVLGPCPAAGAPSGPLPSPFSPPLPLLSAPWASGGSPMGRWPEGGHSDSLSHIVPPLPRPPLCRPFRSTCLAPCLLRLTEPLSSVRTPPSGLCRCPPLLVFLPSQTCRSVSATLLGLSGSAALPAPHQLLRPLAAPPVSWSAPWATVGALPISVLGRGRARLCQERSACSCPCPR